MPDKKSNSSLMPAMGVAFTLIALVALVALWRLKSLGDTTATPTQNVSINNAAPTVSSVLVQDADTETDVTGPGFTPYEGTTHNLKVTTALHDDNGCKDMTSATVLVHLSSGPVVGGGGKGAMTKPTRQTAWAGAPEQDPVLLAAEFNPTPTLSGIYPNQIAANCDNAFVTLAGTGFGSISVVKVNGTTVDSYYSQYDHFLYATLPGALIGSAGDYSITVTNPTPGGGTTDPMTLTVLSSGGECWGEAPQPTPVLEGITPSATGVGCSDLSISLSGYGFTSQSVVKLDGTTITSSYNDDMHSLTATVPASALTTGGEKVVTVTNPSPIGGTSDGQILSVTQGGSCGGTVTIPTCTTESAAGLYCYPVTITAEDMTAAGCTAGQTDVTVVKTIPVQNYAMATDAGDYSSATWAADVTAMDRYESTGVGSAYFEMNSLAGFSTPGTINYGAVSLGAKSDQTFSVMSTGNRDVHALVRANGDMTSNLSGYADIPVGNVQYSLTTPFADGVSVSTGDNLFQICLPQQVLDGAENIPSKNTYWELTMPSSGVNGTYQNTLTLTAQATTGCASPGGGK